MALFCNDIFDTFTGFEIPLLIPSPHAAPTYEHFLTQRGDSYLNKSIYAERWQMMLEVFVQKVYNLGKILLVILVKLEFVGNERINSRAVMEVNIFKKRFWNNGRSTQLVILLWRCWLCRVCCDVRVAWCPVLHGTKIPPSFHLPASFPRAKEKWLNNMCKILSIHIIVKL